MSSRKGKEQLIEEEEASDDLEARKRRAYTPLNWGRGNVASTSTGGGGAVASTSTGGGGGGGSSSNITTAVVEEEESREEESLFWMTDLDCFCFGEFSTAVWQTGVNLEDFSQVEVGRTAIFVGVYDGHGGYQAAEYVGRNLTRNLMDRIRATLTMTEDNLRQAFLRTDAAWLEEVDARFGTHPYIADIGTCCLAGVFWRKILYLANVGDSRAVIAREEEGSEKFVAHQLTRDDNVRDPEVRAEVEALHPQEPGIVVQDPQGVYRIKGRIQISRAIGDAHLKSARFNLNLLNSPVLDDSPALTADPNTYTIPIEPHDRFVIFASDGLWGLMTNQEAVDIVQKHPREGIAARLITEGLTKMAIRLLAEGSSYQDIMRFHYDISVVVVFLNNDLTGEIPQQLNSVKLGCSEQMPPNFIALEEIPADHIRDRTVCFDNLPYATDARTLYREVESSGTVERIVVGSHGFNAEVVFYEATSATRCIDSLRETLILKGKRTSLSLIREKKFRRAFVLLDNLAKVLEVPRTVYVTNLPEGVSVEQISQFFISRGLSPLRLPVIHIKQGRLYAFVVFKSQVEHGIALCFNGEQLLNVPLQIKKSKPPTLKISELDLEPN